METPAHGVLRWVRSSALAVATVGLAATAHAVAGAPVPGPASLALLTLMTVLACVVLTGCRRGLLAVLVAMTVLQVMLHAGFMLLAPMACDPPGGVLDAHVGMHSVVPAAPMSCIATASTAASWHLSAPMVAAHAVATVLLAAALARGERALWHLRELVTPRLPHAHPVSPSPAVEARPEATVVVLTAWTSVSSLVRRGPPSGLVVVPC